MRRNIFTIIITLSLTGGCADFSPDLDSLDDTGSTGETDNGTGSTGDTGDGSETGTTGTDMGTEDTGSSTGTPDGCGDGEAQGMEECDGLDLRGAECTAFASPGSGNYSGGQLKCADDCTLDHGACTYCGDGTKNHASEECDGADLGTLTCEDEGFDGGELGCDEQCGLVQTACENCTGPEDGEWYSKTGCDGSHFITSSGQICSQECQNDTDCSTAGLEICESQPFCTGSRCMLDCSDGKECPAGMICTASGEDNFCLWPT